MARCNRHKNGVQISRKQRRLMADCVLVSQLQRGLFCLAQSNAKWEISAFSVVTVKKNANQNINTYLKQYETLHIKYFCAWFAVAAELTESVAGFLSHLKQNFVDPKLKKPVKLGENLTSISLTDHTFVKCNY